jgi:hypothetical protein
MGSLLMVSRYRSSILQEFIYVQMKWDVSVKNLTLKDDKNDWKDARQGLDKKWEFGVMKLKAYNYHTSHNWKTLSRRRTACAIGQKFTNKTCFFVSRFKTMPLRGLRYWNPSPLRRPPLWSSGQMAADPEVPGSTSRIYRIFWVAVGLERGPLSLVSINEELCKTWGFLGGDYAEWCLLGCCHTA